jgi:Tol biopolymer transport system component
MSRGNHTPGRSQRWRRVARQALMSANLFALLPVGHGRARAVWPARVSAGLIVVAAFAAGLLPASSAGAASNGEIAVADSNDTAGLSAIVLIPSDSFATNANSTFLVSGPGTISNIQWTPDGKTLVYDETARNRTDLYAVDVASPQRRLLAANLPIGIDGVVSPGGTTVAYWRQSGMSVALYLVGVDGGSPRKLAAGVDPTWSADGSRLALLTARGRIETVSADGSAAQLGGRIRTPAGRVINPGLITSFAWAPDGQSFLVSAGFTASANLLETVASTGRTLHVLSRKSLLFAAWSPDGSQVVFTEALAKDREAAAVVDADGSSIVTADGNVVRVVDGDGTQAKVLAYPGEDRELTDPAWQPLP